MHGPRLRGLVWTVLSALLLSLGLLAIVVAGFALGASTGAIRPKGMEVARAGFAIYFRVILLRVLLPQLLVSLALWAALVRVRPAVAATRARALGGLVGAAVLAYPLTVPWLVRLPVGGATFEMNTIGAQLGTALSATLGVAAAAWLARVLTHRSAPEAAPRAHTRRDG